MVFNSNQNQVKWLTKIYSIRRCPRRLTIIVLSLLITPRERTSKYVHNATNLRNENYVTRKLDVVHHREICF